MAIKDLISQAQKSKLGKAISNVVSKVDRDKEKQGFQFISPQTRQNLNDVRTGFVQAGRETGNNPFNNIVSTSQAVLSPINYLKRQAPSQFAQDVSYGLRGASQLTPFQWGNMAGLTSGSETYKSEAPTTDRQKTAQQIGRSTYGLGLTAPLGGANMLKNVSQRAITGTVAGAGLGAGISKVMGGSAIEGAKQGALSGYSFAPLGAITNPLTQKALSGVPNILQNQVGQRAIGGVANLIEDEIQGLIDGYDTNTKSRVTSLVLGAVLTGNDQALKGIRTQLSNMGIKNADDIIKKAKSRLPEGAINLKFEMDGKKFDRVLSKQDARDWTAYLQSKNVKYEVRNLGNQGGFAQLGDTPKPPSLKGNIEQSPKSQLESSKLTTQDLQTKGLEKQNQKILSKSSSSENIIPELKPRAKLLQQVEDLQAKGYPELEANRTVAQIAQEQRSQFNNNGLKDINRIKSLARSKEFAQGDIETLRKKDPKLVDRVVESVREALNNEKMTDTDALDYALQLPNKGSLKVTTPEYLKQASNLKKKAQQVKDLVFNSETDLKVKEKAVKENLDVLNKEALSDFREWEKQLVKQEKLMGVGGQQTRQLNQVLSTIKQGTVPEYITHNNIGKLNDINPVDIGFKDINRNFESVFGKGSKAEKMLLQPFDKSKSKMVDDLEGLAESLDKNIVKKYGFTKGSKESAAIQQFGERNRDYSSLVREFGETKAKNILAADKWFRSQYGKLLDEVNTIRQRIYPGQLDKIIPRRKDYYRHFIEMQEGFKGLRNIFDTPANISPSLAGISAQTQPKSKWLSFAQQRLGNKTTEDAIGGFLEYSKAQTYAKNIDPHSEQFRSFTQQLREQMETYKGDKTKVNNFLEFMDLFTNDLTGKTNPADRFVQTIIGRKPMAILNWVNNRTKANVIVGNVSSAVAQFFNIPQGIAEAGPVNSVKGLGRSIIGLFNDNKAIKESDFIKTRYGDNAFDRFDKGIVADTKKLAVWVTSIGDKIGTRYIWNSVYEKALSQGIENPVKYADDITRKMVAGRGIGEVPVVQKSKVFQLIAPFQLEVANVWHVMSEWVGEKQAGKFVTFFVASHIMNQIAKEVRGSDVSLDPIQAIKEAYNAYSEEEDKGQGLLKAGGRLGGEVLSNVPLGQSVASIYPEYGLKVGDNQLPTRSDLFGEGDPTRFGSGLLASRGVTDPLYNLLPSFGGQQIKRTVQGVGAVNKGYSESKSGKSVRTPIEQNAENYIRGAVFGQYSIPEVREFFDKNRTVLGSKQTEEFKQILSSQGPEQAKAFYDSIISNRTIKSEATKLKEKIDAGSSVDTSKLPTKQAISLIKTKLDNGLEVTDKEVELVYLNDTLKMPQSNRYEKGMRDSDLWTKTGTILDDENLSDAQKQSLTSKIAKELGVTQEDMQIYQIAKQDNNPKTLYTLDQIDKMQSNEELLNYLVKGRKPVNGEILISDGVIDNLVDDGIIPYQLGKDLKKLDFNDDGTTKTKKTSSGSKGGSKSKKDPYATAYKNYLANLANISLPSGKIRTQAPIKISVKGLTFGD